MGNLFVDSSESLDLDAHIEMRCYQSGKMGNKRDQSLQLPCWRFQNINRFTARSLKSRQLNLNKVALMRAMQAYSGERHPTLLGFSIFPALRSNGPGKCWQCSWTELPLLGAAESGLSRHRLSAKGKLLGPARSLDWASTPGGIPWRGRRSGQPAVPLVLAI